VEPVVDGNRWGRLSKLEEMKWKETRVVILMKTSVEVQVCSGDKDLKEYGTYRRSDKSRGRERCRAERRTKRNKVRRLWGV
jgi:hypothetical protein